MIIIIKNKIGDFVTEKKKKRLLPVTSYLHPS